MFINGDTATILINSYVDDFLTQSITDFIYGVSFLDEIKTIEVNICSQGGSVISGYSVYQALLNAKSEGKIVVTNATVAASIAGIIWCAGSEGCRNIDSFGFVMIHNPSGGDDETLLKIRTSLIKILGEIFTENLDEMMDNETWLSAEDLLKLGIITKENIINMGVEMPSIKEPTTNKISEICNSIQKNMNDKMKSKDEKELVKLFVNADEEKEEEETSNADEETETTDEEGEETEEETEEENIIKSLKDRITALEEKINSLSDAIKNTEEEKEETEKVNLLNKVGISKVDQKDWMSLKIDTIKNLTKTIKVNKVAPIVNTKSSLEYTQEIFNSLSKEQKSELQKNDFDTYWKFFSNTK